MSHLITQRFDTGSTTEAYIPLDESDDMLFLGSTQVALSSKSKPRSCRRQTAEQRAERMSACGTPMIRVDPFTGMPRFASYRCQLKECPVCGEFRGQRLHERVENALRDNPIVMSIMPHAAAAQLLHKFSNSGTIHASNYLRIPQRDDTDYIFAVKGTLDEILLAPQLVTTDILNHINWSSIQNTHDDYATSGNLGKRTITKIHDPEEISITTRQIWVSPDDRAALEAAVWSVLSQTYTYNPRTKDEIIHYTNHRVNLLCQELEQRSVQYKVFRVTCIGKLSSTNWIDSIYDSLPFLVERGLVSQAAMDAFASSIAPEIHEKHKIELLPDDYFCD